MATSLTAPRTVCPSLVRVAALVLETPVQLAPGERAVWTSPLAVEQVLVIVDGSIMEAYVDGQASTERVYPRADEVWRISATDASGEAHVPSLRTSSLAN